MKVAWQTFCLLIALTMAWNAANAQNVKISRSGSAQVSSAHRTERFYLKIQQEYAFCTILAIPWPVRPMRG